MDTENFRIKEQRLLDFDNKRTESKVESIHNINYNFPNDFSLNESKNSKNKKGKICLLNYYDPDNRESKSIIVKKLKN